MTVQLARRLFSVNDYERMAATGVLTEDDRVELIEGEIVEMAAIGSRHAASVAALTEILGEQTRGRALAWPQNPLRLQPRSEPEPDFMLLRRRADRYASDLPGPQDVLLLVEVADTTLAYDRDVKVPLYASAGVPEVWLADLDERRVLVYRDPTAEGYRQVLEVSAGAHLSPLAFPDVSLDSEEILV